MYAEEVDGQVSKPGPQPLLAEEAGPSNLTSAYSGGRDDCDKDSNSIYHLETF